jgi:3-isopropylmalate dehydrogenase
MRAGIALLPGDGIGPEVIDSAVTILTKLARLAGHTFDFTSLPIGGAAILAGGRPLADDTLDRCLASDAVLLGAVGDPQFDHLPPASRPESALLRLRRELGAYANLRPARVYPGLEAKSPLKPERLLGTDMLIVRELTGGLYFGEPRSLDLDASRAVNTLPYTGSEIQRVAMIAFEAARKRRQRLTLVDKANVLETSQLWRHVVGRMATTYPDVRYETTYVDACALQLILEPAAFDVILTENLFGDILSDEAGGLVGSLGLLPSASIGGRIGIFEPVHGSAPKLTGTNSANPVGAISSAAMMLHYGLGADREARAVENAVARTLADGCVTADLALPGQSALTCSAMTAAIAERLELG